ncbi:hypothetical protein KC19_2G264300 [Ceratodon purpureus]|uniref:Uncharacterized protein n=1 Tax=Ceratodon purpureus TaxID=3225 RepID=A0A8T0J0I4_CERPU|nr:hypothetical protein KC19_2G264300 [Ceratodon purpureus]
MGGLTLDLRPGAGLGAFNLGMPVCEAFAYVEQHRSFFDVVHVKYNDEVRFVLFQDVSLSD